MSTMTVLTNFVPIHELDDVLYDSNNNYRSDVLKDEDLFLISQLSAPSSPESDSITISKKLQFNTLKLKISDDIDMLGVKDNINELCTNLNDLSDKVLDLSDTVERYKDELSNDYIRRDNELCRNLSNAVSNNYIKKYGEKQISAKTGYFFKKIVINNGILDQSKSEIDAISSYLKIDGTKVSGGCVSGDKLTADITLKVNNANTTQLTCHIEDDCFLTITTQLLETDDSNKPLEVYIRHNDTSTSSKIAQFNNPGGFSGVKYYNYYYNGFPLKCHFDGNHRSITDIVIKYADNSKFKYSTLAGFNDSKVVISQYALYGTVSRDDLDGFVAKDPNTKANNLDLYKIKTNVNGLVTGVEKYDITLEVVKTLPVANDSTLGTIKTNSVLNDPANGKFGVKLDSNKAYVQIPKATTTAYGISKVLSSGTGITVNSSTNTVNLNIASDTTPGGIKTYTGLSDTTNRTFGLKKDASNRAYVLIPEATTTALGLTKKVQSGTGITVNTSSNSVNLNLASNNSLGGIRTGFVTDVNNRNYKVGINNANAYVNIPLATDTGYGVVCLDDLNFVPLPEPDPEEQGDDYTLIPGTVLIINSTSEFVQLFLRTEYVGLNRNITYVEYKILTKKRASSDGDIIDFPDTIDISSAVITSEELTYDKLSNKLPYVKSRTTSADPSGRFGTSKITPFYMEMPSNNALSYKIFAKSMTDSEVDSYMRNVLKAAILYDKTINISNKVYTYATEKIATQGYKKYLVIINGNFQSTRSISFYNIYNDTLGTNGAILSGPTASVAEINPSYRSSSTYNPRASEKFSYLRRYVASRGYKSGSIGSVTQTKDALKSRTKIKSFSYTKPYNTIRVVMSGYETNHTDAAKFKCSNVRVRVFGMSK